MKETVMTNYLSRTTNFPSKADAVIVGGGIIGTAIAYYLSKKLKDVVLLERNGIASEASGANYGMVWLQTRVPGFDLTTARRSQELYDELIKNVFDIDIEYEKVGGLTVFYTKTEKEAAELLVKKRREEKLSINVISGDEARKLEPELSEEIEGAIFCHDDAQLNPLLTTIAFARAAQKQGVGIYCGTELKGIRLFKNSIQSVLTKQGEIKTPILINAAGSWASQIGALVDIKIPVFPRRLESFVTERAPRLLKRIVQGTQTMTMKNPSFEQALKSFSYTQEEAGSRVSIHQVPETQGSFEDNTLMYLKPTVHDNICCGTTFEFVGYNRKVNVDHLSLIASCAIRTIPRLKNMNIIRTWSNFDPYVIDNKPIIGETKIKGFYIASGHGTGLSHGPAAGVDVTQLIDNGKNIPFQDELSIHRFTN